MKITTKHLSLIILLIGVLFASCRQEEFDFQGSPPEKAFQANSNVANLLFRITLNDGSVDNIIDNASCFSVQLPVTVIVNGTEVVVENEDDYDEIESIFDENVDDSDTLEIMFPISIIFSDHTKVTVSNAQELANFAAQCPAENAADEDIECVDISYPIHFSIYNSSSEKFSTVSMPNDIALFNFISAIENADVINMEFPVTLLLTDGTELDASDLTELENHIETFKDSCDEDDDNDFDDDDCKDCNPTELEQVFLSCEEWIVDSLIRNSTNLSDLYNTTSFNFQTEGIVVVTSDTETLYGTWSATGIGNAVDMVIDVPGLDDFNGTWEVNEIAQNNSQGQVNLRKGNDRLRFENACLSGNNTGNTPLEVDEALIDGSWAVDSYMEGDTDQTAVFNGYSLTFDSDKNIVADNGTQINGIWNTKKSSTALELDFGASPPFDLLNNEWRVVSVTETQVELTFVNTMVQGRIDSLILLKL